MPDPIKPTETYVWTASVLWNIKPQEKYTRCPGWDEDEHGERPMLRFGLYVVYCQSGSCVEDWDYQYKLLPGFTEDPPCQYRLSFYRDLIHGYCTPEEAERVYVGRSISVTHGGGRMKVSGCGGVAYGTIIYGIDFRPLQEGTQIQIGKPIEECLFPGVEYTGQVFGCDSEPGCGDLGIGGNWGGDPSRPGKFYFEAEDPFELRCPGFAGNSELYPEEEESPNYALPVYTFQGELTKFDLMGEVEYSLVDFRNTVKWTDQPPKRPKWAEWPPRHTKKGAWVAQVRVEYYQGEDSEILNNWVMELVWNGREGVWMIMVYPRGEKPEKTGRVAPWADVFVNPNPIGPCRLGASPNEELRTFYPLRTKDGTILDGQFVVEQP